MADAELAQRVELALSQSKRVRNEARISVQMLAGLRDHLKSIETQGEEDGRNGSEEGT